MHIEMPDSYDYTKYLKEIEKTKTRGLTTFYFNSRDNKDFQDYSGNQYNAEYEFGAKVIEKENDKYIVEIKNRLKVGDTLEIILPGQIEPIAFELDHLWDVETDEVIDFINPGRANQKVKMKLPVEAKSGYIIRRKKD